MKWTTTSAVAWSTAMMLLLASPTSALGSDEKTISRLPEARAVFTGAEDQLHNTSSELLSLLPTGDISTSNTAEGNQSTDPEAKWEELQKDPEVQKLQAEMKELRSEMRDLREQRMLLIAKKLGITTEGKTSQQIHDEVSQKLGGKKHLFHGKHVQKDRQSDSQN